MAQISPEIRRAISKYVQALDENGIHAQQVFLYGSHAKNRAHEDSDIDIIIVSEDFAAKNLLERLQSLGWARKNVPEPVQAYGFTPEEVEKRDMSAFWEEMLETEAIDITGELAISGEVHVS